MKVSFNEIVIQGHSLFPAEHSDKFYLEFETITLRNENFTEHVNNLGVASNIVPLSTCVGDHVDTVFVSVIVWLLWLPVRISQGLTLKVAKIHRVFFVKVIII